MMKFRIKIQDKSFSVIIADGATFGELVQAVKEICDKNLDNVPEEIGISLNKSSQLMCDESTTLADIGIVSGDLLYVLLPSTVTPSTKISAQVATSQTPDVAQQIREASERRTLDNDITKAGTSIDLSPNEALALANQILFCKDSVPGQVPPLLSKALSEANASNLSEAVCLVIHILNVEVGLTPRGVSPGNVLPTDWKSNPSYYTFSYIHPLVGSKLPCKIVCMSVGRSLVIHAVIGTSTDSLILQLKSSMMTSYVTGEEGIPWHEKLKNLSSLSRVYKASVAYPLVARLKNELEMDSVGLLRLPNEVLIEILLYLSCPDLLCLSESCRQLVPVCRDSAVWRHRYMTDFRGRGLAGSRDTDISEDWFDKYRQRYLVEKELARNQRYWEGSYYLPPYFNRPPPENPFVPVQPWTPPGYLGGEYDIRDPTFPGRGPRPPFGGIRDPTFPLGGPRHPFGGLRPRGPPRPGWPGGGGGGGRPPFGFI